MARRIEVVEYRDSWPEEFMDAAEALRRALGPAALRIDHIGSTSVEGLVAKDVIDCQVTVASLDDASLRPGLEDAGWVWRADLTADRAPPGRLLSTVEVEKRVVTEQPGEREANVHIRVEGRFNQWYALLFRDYLRSNRMIALAYGDIKQNLARLVAEMSYEEAKAGYYAVKDPVFDLIMAAAEDWAAATGWEMDAPDA